MILNVLYLVCCLPVITAGAASTALYSCALNLDEGQPVFRRFWRAFCAGFGKSTALFAVWLVGMVLVLLNVWFYLQFMGSLGSVSQLLSLLPAMLILLISSYFFPLQAQFETTLPQLLRNALSLTVVHLPETLGITLLNCIPVLLLYFKTDVFLYLLAVWSLFGFALIAYLNGYFLKKIFRKHLPEEKSEEENGKGFS